MTLRLGIVGAGIMGEKVAAAAGGLPDVRLTAVVDPDATRASVLADIHSAATFTDLAQLLAEGIVDAVYVGVPHSLHMNACVAALEAGVHVLVDKPLCNDLVEANAILDARDAGGALAMVGFSYRFRAEWIAAREWIAAGAIGRATLIVDTIVEAQPQTPGWYWDRDGGGGVLQLQSHHSFDRIRWLLRDPLDAVSCILLPDRTSDGADHTAAILGRTEGGTALCIGIGFEVRYAAPGIATTVIQGEHGQVEIDSLTRVATLHATDRTERSDGGGDDWMTREVTAFAAACASGDAPAATLEDGVLALRAALAARDSAASSGRWTPV